MMSFGHCVYSRSRLLESIIQFTAKDGHKGMAQAQAAVGDS